MLDGYEVVNRHFDSYNLATLEPYQALVVQAAGNQRLSVKISEGVCGRIVDGNRVCLAHATIADLSRIDMVPCVVQDVSTLIRVGKFWQYGADHMSNRIVSIELFVQSIL